LIYVDYDGDGQLDLTEPTARTNARGEYSITIDRDGPVIIREVIPPGWVQTFPGGPRFRSHHQHPRGRRRYDHGDQLRQQRQPRLRLGQCSRAPYPTLRVDNGARHPILAGYGLGALVVGTPDGEPNADAAAIDNDGVVLPGSVSPGQSFTIRVTNTGTGLLQGWIDWNATGTGTIRASRSSRTYR
jgi:large repetitive protein